MWTKIGRARVHVSRALSSGDAESLGALDRSIDLLLASVKRKSTPAAEAVLRSALLMRTWRALEGGDTTRATALLTDLDRVAPGSEERLALRWRLLEAQLDANAAPEAWQPHARSLLRDPLVRLETDTTPAVLGLVATLWARLSGPVCDDVLTKASPEIRKEPRISATRDLCRVPRDFSTAKDARAWAPWNEAGLVEALAFSPRLEVEGWIVRARLAEWGVESHDGAGARPDLAAMDAATSRACALRRDHPEARYWRARAMLWAAQPVPADLVPGSDASHPSEPRRARLRVLVRATTTGLAPDVDAAVGVLEGNCDASERRLVEEVLARLLPGDVATSPADLRRRAALCKRYEAKAGRKDWSRRTVALAELKAERNYLAAAGILEEIHGDGEAQARTLARVARLLLGEPVARPPKQTPIGAADAAGAALIHLSASPTGTGTPPAADVIAELGQARRDELCEQIPELAGVVDVLADALATLSAARPPALAAMRGGDLPVWCRWLAVRTTFAQTGRPPAAASGLAQAWFVLDVWACTGPPANAPPQVAAAREEFERALVSLAPEHRSWLSDLRRAIDDGGRSAVPSGPRPPARIWGLGKRFEEVCDHEVELGFEYAKRRRELRTAKGPAGGRNAQRPAEDVATRLRTRAESVAPVTAPLWSAVLRYWAAIAALPWHPADRLADLLPDAPDAKRAELLAQLAIAAVAGGRVDDAERFLADQDTGAFPSVAYARALVLERRGDRGGAEAVLRTLEAAFGGRPSTYVEAARRLLAAMAARAGDLDEAERLGRDALKAAPGDTVAACRLAQQILKDAYTRAPDGDPDPGDDIAQVLRVATATGEPPWGERLGLFRELLTVGTDSSQATERRVDAVVGSGDEGLAWRHLLACRLIRAGDVPAADALLHRRVPDRPPAWYERTRLACRTSLLMRTLWTPPAPPTNEQVQTEVDRLAREGLVETGDDAWEMGRASVRRAAEERAISSSRLEELRGCAQAMGALGDDVALAPWRRLAVAALDSAGRASKDPPTAAWEDFGLGALGCVPGLWAREVSRRHAAAQALREGLARLVELPEDRRALLQWLCARVLSDDDGVLDAYPRVLPVLDAIPVSGAGVFTAVAGLWLARREWTRLLDEDLPAAVADLEDDRLRFVLGVGSARAGIEAARRQDARASIARLKQAEDMLAGLLSAARRRRFSEALRTWRRAGGPAEWVAKNAAEWTREDWDQLAEAQATWGPLVQSQRDLDDVAASDRRMKRIVETSRASPLGPVPPTDIGRMIDVLREAAASRRAPDGPPASAEDVKR